MCITWTCSSHQRVELSPKVGLINLFTHPPATPPPPPHCSSSSYYGKMTAHRSLIFSWYSTVLHGDLSIFFWRSLYIYGCRHKYIYMYDMITLGLYRETKKQERTRWNNISDSCTQCTRMHDVNPSKIRCGTATNARITWRWLCFSQDSQSTITELIYLYSMRLVVWPAKVLYPIFPYL